MEHQIDVTVRIRKIVGGYRIVQVVGGNPVPDGEAYGSTVGRAGLVAGKLVQELVETLLTPAAPAPSAAAPAAPGAHSEKKGK